MAVAIDRASLFIDGVMARLKPVRDALLLAGIYYAAKTCVGWLCGAYRGLKTYVLPRVWPRNFKKEYGQWAVVTGCTRGIGLGYAHALAKRGLDVLLIGRNEPVLKEKADELASIYNVQTEVVVADFSHGKAAYRSIEDNLRDKDVGLVINNVGVMYPHAQYFTELDEAIMWDLMMVNVAAATAMMRIVLPGMQSRGRGAIVNIGSAAAFAPRPLISVYAATKAYMDSLTLAVGCEVSGRGVTVQTVDPFFVYTDMVRSYRISRASLFVPEPLAYADSALSTLGFSAHTCGYWAHGLQTHTESIGNGSCWKLKLTKAFHENLRRLALLEKTKQE